MTSLKTDDRDPVEFLAEEFLEQQRRGKNPTIAAYVARYPELAEQIRELFPAVLAMERLKTQADGPFRSRVSLGARKLERLGDFRLLNEIGRGGMGVVYEALHESLGRHVAVKVLPRQSDRQARAFLKEARMVARLHHSNIVPLFGVGEHDGYQYIVMQLIRGVDLEAVLSALRTLGAGGDAFDPDQDSTSSSDGPPTSNDSVRLARALVGSFPGTGEEGFANNVVNSADALSLTSTQRTENAVGSTRAWSKPWGSIFAPSRGTTAARSVTEDAQTFGTHYWQRVASIGRQAAEALHYAHLHRTLHRDIKPANLILDAQGDVWITDFGLAKAMDESHGSHAGTLAGTLRFMAPEQFAGECDHRSDIYGLGLTLYELLTLKPAFSDSSRSNLIRKILEEQPTPIRQICPKTPLDLEAIVMKAIARVPDDRYQAASDFAGDLQRFLDDLPVIARPLSPLQRTWRWARRNRAVAAMSSAAVLFLMTTAIFASAQSIQRTHALAIQSQLRSQADAERELTEANLSLAAKAFDDVFGRITGVPVVASLDATVSEETPFTGSAGMVNERDTKILKGLLSFYDAFAKQNENNVRWQRETARAFRRAGEIQFRLGNHPEARESFQRALAIFQELAASDPTNADLLSKMVVSRNRLANIAWESGRADIALNESRRAWQDLLRRPALLESSAACRIELARAYNQYAIASQQFRFPSRSGKSGGYRRTDPHEYLERSIEIVDALLSESPGNLDYCLTMSESYRCLWWLETQRKQVESAGRARERAIALLTELVEHFPDEPECRYMLAEVYLAPFRFAVEGSQSQQDPSHADRALAISRELAAKFPQVPKYQVVLAQSLATTARIHADTGQSDRALELLNRAIKIQKAVVQQHTARGRFLFDLLHTSEDKVRLVRLYRPIELRPALEDLVTVIEEIPPAFQGFPPFVRSGALAYTELAEVLTADGELESAAAAAAKAQALSEKASLWSRRGTGSAGARSDQSDKPQSRADQNGVPAKS